MAERNHSALGCFFAIAILVGIGYGLYDDHEKNLRAEAEKRAQAEEKAKADAETAAQQNTARQKERESEVLAIDLAKSAHTFRGDWPVARHSDEDVLSNDYYLRHVVSRMKGDLRILGWRAQKYDEDTYVVSFSYEQQGGTHGWPLEVNVAARVVRQVLGDKELEKKYGWGISEK